MRHVTIVEHPDHGTGPMWSVPNWVIQDISEALKELGARRLSKREHHNDVVELTRNWFEDPMQNVTDGVNAIINENPAPEGWEGDGIPVALNEKRQREVLAFKKECQLIKPIPKTKLLTKEHLPKPIEGTLGDRNQFGVGDIIRKLHFVFPLPNDLPGGPAVVDGEDGTKVEE